MRRTFYLLLAMAITVGLAAGPLAAEPAAEGCAVNPTAGAASPAPDPGPSPDPGALLAPVPMAGGEPCGGVVCGAKQYCCNPTCNACLPVGMSCTQEACNSSFATPEVEAMAEPVPEEPAPESPDRE